MNRFKFALCPLCFFAAKFSLRALGVLAVRSFIYAPPRENFSSFRIAHGFGVLTLKMCVVGPKALSAASRYVSDMVGCG